MSAGARLRARVVAARRRRCACRRVLLAPGETLREQVGVGPTGPKVALHRHAACGVQTLPLPLPDAPSPPRPWQDTDREGP